MLKISAEMLRQLQHLPNNVAPHDVIIDFEHGLTAALNQDYFVFLKITIYWHDQELGLSMPTSGFLKAFRGFHSFSKVYIRVLVFAWCFISNSNSSTSSSVSFGFGWKVCAISSDMSRLYVL